MGGVSMQALVTLTNEWENQVLVVLSFTLKVFLFSPARICRLNVWSIPMACISAMYALGAIRTLRLDDVPPHNVP